MTKLETLNSFKGSAPSKASSLAETQLQMQSLQNEFSQTLTQMQDLQQQFLLSQSTLSQSVSEMQTLREQIAVSQSKLDKSQKSLSIERQRLRQLMAQRADWTQLIAVAVISSLLAAGLSMLLK